MSDYQNEIGFEDVYAARLLREQIQKIVQEELKKINYNKEAQALILSATPNTGLVNISMLTAIGATPNIINDVKLRECVAVEPGDQVYVEGINGSFTNMFVDLNKSMATDAVRRLFTSTQDIIITNRNDEVIMLYGGKGSLYLPTYFFKTGRTLKITVWGYLSTPSSPPPVNIRERIWIGSNIILDMPWFAVAQPLTNQLFQMEAIITCNYINGDYSLATLRGQGKVEQYYTYPMVQTSPVVIDNTVANYIYITHQWDIVNPNTFWTATNGLIEIID